jgi:hypothetical protein
MYFFYLLTSIERMHYILKNHGVFIHYGFTNILLPYGQIRRVERVRTTNWSKIAGIAWSNYFIGWFNEFKYGLIHMFGTSKSSVILIYTDDRIYGITPYDNNAFLEQLAEQVHPDKHFKPHPVGNRVWHNTGALAVAALNLAALIGQVIFLGAAIGGDKLTVLDYNLLGAATEHRWHYELFILPLVCIFVFGRMIYITDYLQKNATRPGYRYLAQSILLTLLVTGLIGSFIYLSV